MWLPLRSYAKGTGRECRRVLDRVMGMGREPGMFLCKKNCRCQNVRITNKSEKVCARIFDEFWTCSGLPKISVFGWTIQNIMTLILPLYFDIGRKMFFLREKNRDGEPKPRGVHYWKGKGMEITGTQCLRYVFQKYQVLRGGSSSSGFLKGT